MEIKRGYFTTREIASFFIFCSDTSRKIGFIEAILKSLF